MASKVSYTQAAKVAVIAVAADLYFNQGQTVNAAALAILGNCALGLGKKVYDSFCFFREFRHRCAYTRDIQNPFKEQEALIQALERIQIDYPEEFGRYIKSKKLSSKEDILEFFTETLSEGCCAGTANALFDKIVGKQSHSLEKSVKLLQSEDVFYLQILGKMHTHEKIEKDYSYTEALKNMKKLYPTLDSVEITWEYRMKNLEKRCDKRRNNLGADLVSQAVDLEQLHSLKKEYESQIPNNIVFSSSDSSKKKWMRKAGKIKARIEKGCEKRLKHIGQKHHFSTFLESEKFLVTASCEIYQAALEKLMLQFPQSQNFVGVIYLPNHVMSFQCGPDGCFIYDAFDSNKGLFSYFEFEKFIEELRHHALWDTQHTKYSIVEKEKQGVELDELREDAEELVKKFPTRLSIRPLDDINPSFKEKEQSSGAGS